MIESAIAQGIFKIFLAIIGILAGRLSLLWMDRAVQKSLDDNDNETYFKAFMESSDSEDLAKYYGARLIFVAIIIAGAIS